MSDSITANRPLAKRTSRAEIFAATPCACRGMWGLPDSTEILRAAASSSRLRSEAIKFGAIRRPPLPIQGIATGTWTVRIHGREIRDGKYDGWIERDDPRQLPRQPGGATPLAFPSFFSERSSVDRSSISTLACGHRVIAVANLDEPNEKVNISSSEGPTRDGRSKPDVAAAGTNVVAASGFTGADQRWVEMTGTSMASPYVCGVAALMLATNKNLSAAQIAGIMQRTSRPLPGHDYAWRKDAGFGRIDAEACVKEAKLINQRLDKT